jgi:hypothetical protein
VSLRGLSARDRRALIVAGASVLLVLLWTLAIHPYLNAVAEARERLEAARELLRREVQVVVEAQRLPPLWEAGSAELLRVAPRMLSGSSDGAATAALTGYLQAAAQLSRVLITQVEPLPTSHAGHGVTALEVRLRAESDLEGLLSFLEALESGPKLLRLGPLQIRASGAGVPYITSGPEVLTLQLTVAGFSLGENLPVNADGRTAAPEAP